MSSTLARIEARVSQELKEQIASLAQTRGVSVHAIGGAAIQELLEPGRPKASAPDGGINLAQIEHLLTCFIRVFFTVTPPVAEADPHAATPRGEERYSTFLQLVEGERA